MAIGTGLPARRCAIRRTTVNILHVYSLSEHYMTYKYTYIHVMVWNLNYSAKQAVKTPTDCYYSKLLQ